MFEGELEVSLSGSNNVLEITPLMFQKVVQRLIFAYQKATLIQVKQFTLVIQWTTHQQKAKIGKLIAILNSVEELKQMALMISQNMNVITQV
ncbi:hypothetical protein [Mycoplasmopsis cynos]|uniref:hypothetical protein n=1 Tax=Mycoplasmopsis cynos TaxID=171284 RepID=UPI00220F02A7|nr:hypothetical protein [Mycoplasmopsis cynos]UWV92689.1 hypothetical protein NWE57_01095 [Mycoplasmopsis cynos]